MQEEIIIKKDFLNLLKGDIITISTDGDGRIYFSIENRTRKVRFYGNKKVNGVEIIHIQMTNQNLY